MHRYRLTTPAVALAAWLLATAAAGQDRQGLAFSAGLGYERGGPGPSLMESLDGAGWGDTSNQLGSGIVEYPQAFSEGLNLSFLVGARYRQGPYSIDLLFSNGARGHAEGYRAATRSKLLITWMSLRATATVGVHLGPLRVAAGPTLEAVFWSGERDWTDLGGTLTPVLGGTATAGLGVPVGSDQISLAVGVRTLPTIDLRPFLHMPIEARYGTFFIAMTVQG